MRWSYVVSSGLTFNLKELQRGNCIELEIVFVGERSLASTQERVKSIEGFL